MIQPPPIDQIIQEAAVRIGDVNEGGSGFFVAPGKILTCAHVISHLLRNHTNVSIQLRSGEELVCDHANIKLDYNNDLALLDVGTQNRPTLELGPIENVGDECYVWGFPNGTHRDGDSLLLTYEGPYGNNNAGLKFKDSRVSTGFSGAPVVSLKTQRVVGVLAITIDDRLPIGCRAVPTHIILRSFPSLGSQSIRSNTESSLSLPFEHIECVGRTEEINNVANAALQRGSVLLFGAPGIGKSLVASKAAAAIASQNVDYGKAYWVDASDIHTPEELVSRILSRLDLIQHAPMSERIFAYARTNLALLPNLTLVIDGIQSNGVAANAIGKAIPKNCRVIGTSNSRLNIFRKKIRLQPLSPDNSRDLFVMELDDFILSQGTTEAVDKICESVDHHPLAITLLSSKCASESLDPKLLAEKLTDEISVWREAHNADTDHGSLLNISISQSIEQLPETDRLVLHQLAHSPRNIRENLLLEAVEFAFNLDSENAIGSLIRRNLVSRTNGILSTHTLIRGHVVANNLSMAERCRTALILAVSSGLARLSAESWNIHDVELFSHLMDISEANLNLNEQTKRLLTLIQVWAIDDTSPLSLLGLVSLQTRAAIRLAESIDDVVKDIGVPAALNLANFWRHTGNHDAAISLLYSLIDQPLSPAEEAHVRISVANATMLVHGFEESASQLIRARSLAKSIDSDILLASSTGQLGRLAWEMQLNGPAILYYRGALKLYEELNQPQGISACNHHLGLLAGRLGFHKSARLHLKKAAEVDRDLDDAMGELQSLSELSKTPGGDTEWIDLRIEQLAIQLESRGIPEGVGKARFTQGDLVAYSGSSDDNLTQALPIYESALRAFELAGDTSGTGQVCGQLGLTMYWLNRQEEAENYTHRALQSYTAQSNPEGIGLSLVQMAHILIQSRKAPAAERVLEQSLPFLIETRSALFPHVKDLLDNPEDLRHPERVSLSKGNPGEVSIGSPDPFIVTAPISAFADARLSVQDQVVKDTLLLSLSLIHPYEIPIHSLQAALETDISEDHISQLVEALYATGLFRESSFQIGRVSTVKPTGDFSDLAQDQLASALKLSADMVGLSIPSQPVVPPYLLTPQEAIPVSLHLNAISRWLNISDETLHSLIQNASSFLMDEGSPGAATLCLDALEKHVSATTQCPRDRMALLNNLGTAMGALELHEESTDLLVEALDEMSSHLETFDGRELLDLRGKLISNLGHRYLTEEKYGEAWNCFKEALITHQRANGIIHRSTAIDLSNLGLVKSMIGDARNSTILYRRSLGIWESLGNCSDRQALTTRVQLAGPLFGVGEAEEAEKHLRFVNSKLDSGPYAFSMSHFEAAKGLALLLMATERFSEALEYLHTAEAIAGVRFGRRTGFYRYIAELIEESEEALHQQSTANSDPS